MSLLGSPVVARAAPVAAAVTVGALARTLRLQVRGVEALAPLWAARRPLIYAVWHGRVLLAPWLNAWLRRTRGARTACVLASRSRDGEMIARFVACFGLPAVRGSSSRGGAAALRQLARRIAHGEDVAVVPDGPRGPRGRVQPGIVLLAALTGAPVVPLAVAARPARALATWDAFMLPVPFARCAAVLGAPVGVAAGAEREEARRGIEAALDAVTAAADALVAA